MIPTSGSSHESKEALLIGSEAIARVSKMRMNERDYVIKLREQWRFPHMASVARRVRAMLVSWLCRLIFRQRPDPRLLLRNDVWHEGQRLMHLHAHGANVPDVIHCSPAVLVMESVGRVFPEHIREAPPQDRPLWLDKAAIALADFHVKGFWHGGAQLRNITWFKDSVWRLDFEEAVGDSVSLQVAQAYDVFQLVQSTMQAKEFSEDQRVSLGARMLFFYLADNPDPEVRVSLAQLAKALHKLRGLLALLRRLPGRDVRAMFYTSEVLRLMELAFIREADAGKLRIWANLVGQGQYHNMADVISQLSSVTPPIRPE